MQRVTEGITKFVGNDESLTISGELNSGGFLRKFSLPIIHQA